MIGSIKSAAPQRGQGAIGQISIKQAMMANAITASGGSARWLLIHDQAAIESSKPRLASVMALNQAIGKAAKEVETDATKAKRSEAGVITKVIQGIAIALASGASQAICEKNSTESGIMTMLAAHCPRNASSKLFLKPCKGMTVC